MIAHHPPVESAAVLVARVRAGDQQALATLMERYRGAMVRAARRYLASASDVEDAVQDAWLAFARFGEDVRRPECIGAWLQVATGRAALVIARRLGRIRPMGDVSRLPGFPVWWDDQEHLDDDQYEAAVSSAIGRLNPRERSLVTLLMDDPQMPYASVSEALGRPIGSLGPTRQRALRKLRRDPGLSRLVVVA